MSIQSVCCDTDEDAILRLAKSGCEESLNTILRMVRSCVENRVNFLLCKPEWQPEIDIDVVVSTVICEVWKSFKACDAKTYRTFMGWVYKITSNKCIHATEKALAKKRGGHVSIVRTSCFDAYIRVEDETEELVCFKETVEKLEVAMEGNKNGLVVLDFLVGSGDIRVNAGYVAEAIGKSRNYAYSAISKFRKSAAEALSKTYDSDVVEAVKEGISNNSRRSLLRNVYGLTQSDLDCIELMEVEA